MTYNIIYADPAWEYAARATNKITRFGSGVHGQYDVMTELELCSMRNYIQSLMADNCALFMWATGPRQDMALRVVEAWNEGVRYKRDKLRFVTGKAFTWIKAAKKIKLPQDVTVRLPRGKKLVLPEGTVIPFQMLNERTVIGMKALTGPGNYTASNTEDVMLFVKGRMPVVEKLVPSVIIHPRMDHSRKPSETRDRIVRACGDLPRIELFARDQAPGWDANGLELDGTDYRKLLLAA